MYVIQHCFICRPSESTVSEDAAIEPRTVATLTFDHFVEISSTLQSRYSANTSSQKRVLSTSLAGWTAFPRAPSWLLYEV
jgi:hypothetical protein